MANIKSAKKRVLVTKRQNEHNKSIKSELRTILKKAAAEDADGAIITTAIKKLDKAASKNLIHKNKAARLKSKLAKKQNASA